MNVVMHAMLGNAAVAAVLTVLALVVGRTCRLPAVRHVAWVLVLLKLVTPPLFSVPLPVLPPAEDDKVTRWQGDKVTGSVQYLPPSEFAVQTEYHSDHLVTLSPCHLVIFVWFAGAAGWFVWQGRRIVRFGCRVARAEDAGPEVAAAALRIALALGVANPPAVKVATGIGSPMLWGWGRGTVVLFPRELLARLAPEARDTLLAHELAHFLRRDHWVRVLEFVATGLYWWHPAVWLARSGIETAEEECCDAWVVGGLAASPRRYAEALLATVDFAAELQRHCLPPGACAANRSARLLHRRLVGIIHAERPSRLRGAGWVRAAVGSVLLIQPVLVAATLEVTEAPGAKVDAGRMKDESEKILSHPSSLIPHPSAEPRAWAIAPAPDGAMTAMARDHEVVLRRPDGTVKVLGPGKPVALAFAPDGKRLATAGPGTLVRTWDDRGGLLAEAQVPAAARGLTYTPDGTSLLILDAAGGISVRDPNTLAPLSSWTVERPANSITCSPDGQCVAVAFGSWLDAETGWVECWSIGERRKLATYQASAPVGATRFTPDGRMLIIGGWNGLLAWRTLPGGELVAERQLPKALVASAAFSPDAATLPLDPPPEPATPPESLQQKVPELVEGVSHHPKR